MYPGRVICNNKNPVNSWKPLIDNAKGNHEPSLRDKEGAETILIRVQSSDWKSRAPEMGEDIVQTIWKHIEVHKRTG